MKEETRQILRNQEVIMEALSLLLKKELGEIIGESAVKGIKMDEEIIGNYSKALVNLNYQTKQTKLLKALSSTNDL